MNLVGSVIIRNELDRYLRWTLPHLLTFCDQVRVFDDGSTDDWADRLELAPEAIDRLHVLRSEESTFFEHEGRARQTLLDWTMQGDPTHVLAIDADEFVDDGAELRRLLEHRREPAVWTLTMREVWKAGDDCLCIRQDGGWHERDVPILYRVPRRLDNTWRIPDRQLAPGREPAAVRTLARGRRTATGVAVLHMGWACKADRAARYARYVEHDGGKFHADHHLKSIMWGDRRVTLEGIEWPPELAANQAAILERIQRV